MTSLEVDSIRSVVSTVPDADVVTVRAGDGKVVPVVFDSPHSGSNYPSDFNHIIPIEKIRRAEDMYVDELFGAAPDHGATLIAAQFPRSYIDPNRSLEDLDPELLAESWPEPVRPGEKARLGHGLIWRLCPPDMNLYIEKLSPEEVRRRIDGYWRPYHEALRQALDDLYERFDAVWHLNCHSMPSMSRGPFVNGGGQADFVLGDRDGTTTSPDFLHLVRDSLRAMGYSVKINDPYKGVELVRAYSDPARRRFSLQIEINRALYMDETTFDRLPRFRDLKVDLTRLIAAICRHAA
jgi:N-formylglutamate amidohydrolase